MVAAATSGLLLIHALTNVPESVLQREFSVKRRLIVGPAIAISYAVVAVGLAALGWGVWSMVVGTYASYIAWVVSLWVLTSWRPGRGRASYEMWRELARYGFPLVLAMIGYRVRTAVESLVVGRFLSTGALGFFRYGQRIALIPQTRHHRRSARPRCSPRSPGSPTTGTASPPRTCGRCTGPWSARRSARA